MTRPRKHPHDFAGSQVAAYDPGPFDPRCYVEVVDHPRDLDDPAVVLVSSVHREAFFYVDPRSLEPIGPVARELLKVRA